MGKKEFQVIGSWAIRLRDGQLRCLLCKRHCRNFEDNPSEPIHYCDYQREMTLGDDNVKIPEFVVLMVQNYKAIRKMG